MEGDTLYIYVRVTCARRRRRGRGKIGICGYEEKKKQGKKGLTGKKRKMSSPTPPTGYSSSREEEKWIEIEREGIQKKTELLTKLRTHKMKRIKKTIYTG